MDHCANCPQTCRPRVFFLQPVVEGFDFPVFGPDLPECRLDLLPFVTGCMVEGWIVRGYAHLLSEHRYLMSLARVQVFQDFEQLALSSCTLVRSPYHDLLSREWACGKHMYIIRRHAFWHYVCVPLAETATIDLISTDGVLIMFFMYYLLPTCLISVFSEVKCHWADFQCLIQL